jgi:hypothetical protein
MPEKLKQIINSDETVIDFILLIFSCIITFYLIPEKSILIKILNPYSVLILIFFIEFFCILFISEQYKKMFKFSEKKDAGFIAKFLFFITVTGLYFIMIITVVFFNLYIGNTALEYLKSNHELSLVIFVILGFPIMLGYLIGFPAETWKKTNYIIYVPATLYFLMLLISTATFFYHSLPLWALFIFITGAGGLIVPVYLKTSKKHSGLRKKIENRYLKYRAIRKIWKSILLPLIIIVMFIFWEELVLITMVQTAYNNDIVLNPLIILFSLLLSGILPLRLLALLTPPFKIINIITGILVLYFYFNSLCMQLPVLADLIS